MNNHQIIDAIIELANRADPPLKPLELEEMVLFRINSNGGVFTSGLAGAGKRFLPSEGERLIQGIHQRATLPEEPT